MASDQKRNALGLVVFFAEMRGVLVDLTEIATRCETLARADHAAELLEVTLQIRDKLALLHMCTDAVCDQWQTVQWSKSPPDSG